MNVKTTVTFTDLIEFLSLILHSNGKG